MIYADTDFFLAIAKKEDWLKTAAQKVYRTYQGNITTSVTAIIESALIAKKKSLEDIEELIGSIFEIATVEGMTAEEGMQVAHLIKAENLSVFDAFHAVLSRGMPIASSERVYDRIGLQRIKLEGE